jgi:hypothetical protein
MTVAVTGTSKDPLMPTRMRRVVWYWPATSPPSNVTVIGNWPSAGMVNGPLGDLVHGRVLGQEQVAGESHPPVGEVLHGCLAEGLLEDAGEGGAGHIAQPGQVIDGPLFGASAAAGSIPRTHGTVFMSGAATQAGNINI